MSKETEAKKEVIDACHRLVKEGLVTRTWGNVSCRIDENYFVITPSGRDYESLTTESLVVVDINTCEYDGAIKPSSEKGIHADAYKLRPDIDFVIHTHQFYASVISAAGVSISAAPLVPYGLPGTKGLRRNVLNVMSLEPVNVFLLERHGALCLGQDADKAFEEATRLENQCKLLYEKEVPADSKLTGRVKPYLDDYAQIVGFGKSKVLSDDREAVRIITEKNMAAALYAPDAGPLGFVDAGLQRLVFKYKYSKLKNK